ncbi:hypothetical protein LCGC14_0425380, partial [marine sediment metagenome]
MTYAQRCKACKEVFVLQEMAKSCPSCAAAMPAKNRKSENIFTGIPEVGQIPGMPEVLAKQMAKDICKNMTWQEWQKLEPKKLEQEKPTSDTNDVISEFLAINEELASLYNLLYGFMSKSTKIIKADRHADQSMSNETMCDFGFFCREAENTLDELRKEVKARKELCGQTIAIRKTQDSLSDPNIKLKVAGQYATGSPDVKMQAKLPKKFTDEYYQITDFFKVPREVAAAGVFCVCCKLDYLTNTSSMGDRIDNWKQTLLMIKDN